MYSWCDLPCLPTRYIPSAMTVFLGTDKALLLGVVYGVTVMAGLGSYFWSLLLSIVVFFLKQV